MKFGKKKWRVVKELPKYNPETQKRLVFITLGLHNFIQRSNILDDDLLIVSENEDRDRQHETDENDINELEEAEATSDGAYMATIRNQIADMLWADHR